MEMSNVDIINYLTAIQNELTVNITGYLVAIQNNLSVDIIPTLNLVWNKVNRHLQKLESLV